MLPMPTVRIRPVSSADSLNDLTLLIRRAYAPLAAMGFHFVATYQDDATTRERIVKGECLVAELDGRISGYDPPAPTTPSARCASTTTAACGELPPTRRGPRRSAARHRTIGSWQRSKRAPASWAVSELALDTAEGAAT